ncbi:MAG: hypothetical protein ABR532_02565 [Candidatus Dormibacteria bacterium]
MATHPVAQHTHRFLDIFGKIFGAFHKALTMGQEVTPLLDDLQAIADKHAGTDSGSASPSTGGQQ